MPSAPGRSTWVRPPPRYKVRFPDTDSLEAALAARVPGVYDQYRVVNRKRSYVSVEAPSLIAAGRSRWQRVVPTISYRVPAIHSRMFSAFDGGLASLDHDFGVELEPELQYEPEQQAAPEWWPFAPRDRQRMRSVLEAINAPVTHGASGGAGSVIAIVDTGIDGKRAGIEFSRRANGFSTGGAGDPWRDPARHGTRSALIAAGRDGIARGATVYPCRTNFYEGELTDIFDHLVDQVLPSLGPRRLIISNSYGFRSGTPPRVDGDLAAAIADAVAANVVVAFSAGNYHELAGGVSSSCSPTSIWTYKCLDGVLTVAAGTLGGGMQPYSSRGPGQLAGEPGMTHKPDVTAPVPDRWASSGACPQVAGLAALLLDADRSQDARTVRERIVGSARAIGHGPDCEGAGFIDCRAALATTP